MACGEPIQKQECCPGPNGESDCRTFEPPVVISGEDWRDWCSLIPDLMTFDGYKTEALKTAVYKNVGNNYDYPLKGLVSEVGELAGKLKKIERDKDGVITLEDIKALSGELGDILWYIAALSMEFGLSLSQIARDNLSKLKSRQERGQIHGSGDNR